MLKPSDIIGYLVAHDRHDMAAMVAELERQSAEQRRRADEAEEMREKLRRAAWHLAYEDARRRGFGPGAGRLAGDAVNAALAATAEWRDTPAAAPVLDGEELPTCSGDERTSP